MAVAVDPDVGLEVQDQRLEVAGEGRVEGERRAAPELFGDGARRRQVVGDDDGRAVVRARQDVGDEGKVCLVLRARVARGE